MICCCVPSCLLQVALGEQPCSNDGHSWRLMHGDDGTPLTSRMLTTVHEVLQESFDPIISDVSGARLTRSLANCCQLAAGADPADVDNCIYCASLLPLH